MRAMPLPVGERVYQLKVTLRHIRPPVWRRLQVGGDTTLGQLNRYLQVAMGWWNSHLHLFQIGRTEYRQPDPEEDLFWESTAKDENAAVLGEVVPAEKEKFRYVYDFGDHWEHEIVVEKILPRGGDLAYPVCLAGQRACPPEDCGGPGGYRELLQALSDPDHPEHESWTEWVPDGFEAEECDLEELNRRLRSPDTYADWED